MLQTGPWTENYLQFCDDSIAVSCLVFAIVGSAVHTHHASGVGSTSVLGLLPSYREICSLFEDQSNA